MSHRHVRLAVLTLVTSAVALGACGDSSGPGNGDNVSESDFPRTATGGDPRGTYSPNDPLLAWFNLPPAVGVNMSRNSGTGTIEVTGSSATSGSFTMSNVQLDVAGTISGGGVTIPFDFSDVDQGLLTSGSGTWRVLPNNLLEMKPDDPTEDPDTVGFSTTGRGLFFVTADTVAPGQIFTAVIAFKR